MTPKQYENYIGSIFAKRGYDVVISPYSNDWGIDVVAIKENEKIGIQAKMYGQSSRSINRRVIMELYGASAYQDCTRTILATDGNIMPDAVNVAEKLGIEILLTSNIEDSIKITKLNKAETQITNALEQVNKTLAVSFDEAWQTYIMPLTGNTLRNSRGTNYISCVDWSGIKRVTSNGKNRRIDIEGFRLTYNTLMRKGFITRDYINQQVDQRCSSGIVLILGQIPFIEITSSPAGLRLK